MKTMKAVVYVRYRTAGGTSKRMESNAVHGQV